MGTNNETNIEINLENIEDIEDEKPDPQQRNSDSTEDENQIQSLSNEKHQCWVCFANEGDIDESNEWVRPCRCKGTAQWVHQECLNRWIDEKQRLNSSATVKCSQCNTEYLLVFPTTGRFVYTIEWFDRLIYTGSPFLAITCIVGSIYWCALSYGALTVIQVMGQNEGKTILETSDPLTLLVGLPSIPVMLILGKLVRYENKILAFWRNNHNKIPFLDYLIGSPEEKTRQSAETLLYSNDTLSDPISVCRLVCGALLLPTFSSICGRFLYDKIGSNLYKTILGGITFVGVKQSLKIYLRIKQYIRQSKRKVLNFNEDKPQQTTKMPEMQEISL